MKRSVKNRGNYSKFRRKILLQCLGSIVAAFLFIVALYFLVWRGTVGDILLSLFQIFFRMSRDEAYYLYDDAFRDNFNLLFMAAVTVTFLCLLFLILRRFTRYFDLINDGIDALATDQESKIVLKPEMEAIEQKLNSVRQTLIQRSKDAKSAEQRKNDLVMYLAHDIRTPLTSVIGYLSLIDEMPDMPEEQKLKQVRVALEKANRLEYLVNELFEITRFNSQVITLSKRNIDLYYMLVQISDEFYPQLSQSGKRVSIDAVEDLTVLGDPDKLARVFNNILKNAIAYSEQDSEIQISVKTTQDKILIVFKNQGTIAEEKLGLIFEKFYRADHSRPTATGGSGLGLAIAKEIVELHNGKISAESCDGETSFIVELPFSPAAEGEKPRQQ